MLDCVCGIVYSSIVYIVESSVQYFVYGILVCVLFCMLDCVCGIAYSGIVYIVKSVRYISCMIFWCVILYIELSVRTRKFIVDSLRVELYCCESCLWVKDADRLR